MSKTSADTKTYLVSGATGAIGQAIARGLATGGGRVILAARDEAKADRTRKAIEKATGNGALEIMIADLSEPDAAKKLARDFKGGLDVLVNNAAISPRRRQESDDGVEIQFAVNVLGYFQLTQAFAPLLARSAGARIVNVASYWAGDLNMDDLEFKTRMYNSDSAYRQSKQANRMLSAAFAERLKPKNVTVNACHPGDVTSNLSKSLGFGGSMTPDQGAATPLWLATSPRLRASGRYYEDRADTTCKFSKNKDAVERLFAACEDYQKRRLR